MPQDLETYALISAVLLWPAALFVGRNWLRSHIERSVQFGFDQKLEAIRSDLRTAEESFRSGIRSREAEIASLRDRVFSARANRTSLIDTKKIEAIEHLWLITSKLASYKLCAAMFTIVSIEQASEVAPANAKFRAFLDAITAGEATNPSNAPQSHTEQLYVNEPCWACFSAYRLVLMIACAQVHTLKVGATDVHKLVQMTKINEAVIAVLPHRASYVLEHPQSAAFFLVDDLEKAVFSELKKELEGRQTDEEELKRASAVLNSVKEFERESSQRALEAATP